MTRKLSFPFTETHLGRSRQEIAEQFEGADEMMIQWGVANEVIINVFGRACWGTRFAGTRRDPYFAEGRDGSLDAYIHQRRVLGLANDLLVCQYFDGFAEQREEMSKQSLIGVYHELRVARMLHDSGRTVAFVVPSRVKEADFDLRVDGVLATEVKAKEDQTPYKPSSLESTLGNARSQLPSAGPGLIVLRIPDAWAVDPNFVAEADDVFQGVIRGSRRINAILVLWDEWLRGSPRGAACLTRFRVYENPAPRADFADLPRVLRSAAVDGSLENGDMEFPAGEYTFVCAVRRHAGDGPLFETFDGGLQVIFDRGGFIANRVGGEVRTTQTPIDAINGRWVNVMFRFRGALAELRVDDHVIDSWGASARDYSGLRVMPAVDADLRQHIVYATRLADADVDQLFASLTANRGGPYIQFRRGDVARYRTGDL
jgi:hypothetical protein